MPESKMQLRVKLIQLLSKYRKDNEDNNKEIAQDIIKLKLIEDKKYLGKLLFKEISSDDNTNYIHACAIIALEILDEDTFENYAIDFLQDKNNSDDKKFLVISLIKQKGISFNYEDVESYINNPEEIAKESMGDFLLSAINDPEAQIDLLDFYINVPKEEKFYILDNLSKENSQDIISNCLSLIVKTEVDKDELEYMVKELLNSNSPYSIDGLNYILENCKINLKLRQKVKNKYLELNKKFPDFKNDDVIKNSEILDSFISFIDGNNNFSIILSRKMNNGAIDAMFLTINTIQGIVSCMGFGNIANSSYLTIKKRLFPDSMPIKINPMALKKIYTHYLNKNKKTKTKPPYELIVWEKLLSDIKDINYDISKFINSKLDTLNLTETKVKNFFKSKLLETWYWIYGQNQLIDELFDLIEEKHYTEYEKIEQLISDFTDNKLLTNELFAQEITDRLLLQSYISHLAGLKISSKVAYSLCFKNPYYKMLIAYLIDKSLYEYFIDCFEIILKNKQSVFKHKKQSLYSESELESLIAQIEEKWS